MSNPQVPPGQPYDFASLYADRPWPRLADVNGMSRPDALMWYHRNGYHVRPQRSQPDGYRALVMPPGQRYSFDDLEPPSAAEVAWLAQNWNPAWQLGMVMGQRSGLWALDVDDMEQWARFQARYDGLISPTAIQETGREGGGLTVIYQRPEEVPPLLLRQAAWSDEFPAIEVKSRAVITVAPSVHHRTRKQYLWRPGIPEPADKAHRLLAARASALEDELARHKAADLRIADKARRMVAAEGWKPPAASASLSDELTRPRETYAYRIGGLAGWNHNVLVFGPRKTGKTQLMINLAAALSCSSCTQQPNGSWAWTPGTFLPWPGFQCWMGGNVAVVNAEMDADDWRDEFRRLPAGACCPARIFPLHLRGEPFSVITLPAAREWFTAWLVERRIEVLIIDTWGQFAAQNGVRNLNDDAEVRVILAGLDEIKAATGVRSLFILIHTPHQVPGQKHLERFKGAGATGDWADVLWSYLADEDGIRYLSATGRARIDLPESALYFSPETGLLSWAGTGSREQTAAGRTAAKVMAALERGGLLTEELLDAVGGHRDSARKLVKRMAANGKLDSSKEGSGIRYFLPGSGLRSS